MKKYLKVLNSFTFKVITIMNNTLRTRLLTILFIFGLGVYALLPSIRYQLLSDEQKNTLSKDEVAYFDSKSIKQGLI